jgi:hypothetical protein
MSTMNIKNLSISLEALSRIPDSANLSYDIRNLLEQEIKYEEDRLDKLKEVTTLLPTKPNIDDEIPF